MGGLQRLYFRILPIITLICFICFGVTHIFDRNETKHITYLTHETINTGTAENPIYIENYNFDMRSYIDNIDINILERATNQVIDTNTFENTLYRFNQIWENGYDVGDVSMTIINGIILVVNGILTMINMTLIPIRIACGILLTAFSLVGININVETPITKSLNWLLDSLQIPLIQPTDTNTSGQYTDLYQTEWLIDEVVTSQTGWDTQQFNFTTANNQTFNAIRLLKNGNNYTLQYMFYANNTWYHRDVYDNIDGWSQQEDRRITITSQNLTQEDIANIRAFLSTIGEEVTP